MLTQFIDWAMKKAKYELLEWDEGYYWEISWFDWVWANGVTLEDCRLELQEVLEEWILLKVRKRLFVPRVDNYDLNKILCED